MPRFSGKVRPFLVYYRSRKKLPQPFRGIHLLNNLLIVEDNEPAQNPLSRFLEEKGYTVHTVRTIRDALPYCQNGQPQIVLADLHLPDGTALDLLQKVRQTSRETVFVLITEMGEVNLVLEALRLGADDYLFKPFTNLENVASVIEKQVKKHPVGKRMLTDADLEQLDKLQQMIQTSDFHMVFQPIFRLDDRSIFGYEALMRPGPSSPMPNPGTLMELAEQLGVARKLDLICIEKALATTPPNAPRLFVNIETETVADPDSLLEVVALAEKSKQPLVLEVTERRTVINLGILSGPCEVLRKKKIALAVDDVGSGYASIERVLSIRPQFLKIAMSITRSVDADTIRRVMAESILYMSERIGASVIAEGIETEKELAILKRVGVKLGQGYYLSPKP